MDDKGKMILYREYRPKIFGYLYKRLENRETAEDLTSDVFLKVMEKIEGFDSGKASLSTWIYAIASNRLIDYYRTRHVTVEVNESITASELEVSPEALDSLADALERLEVRERTLIILRYYKELPLKKTAERMGISYSYAKLLNAQALEKMKKFLS
ncbi:MAG: sigma-70 family RNA polymerase sigma factor [Spirochaetales bacterium]|nr:sigma-70 family RNA polymerase sigma factor [Candidatus Physcosoma equi]